MGRRYLYLLLFGIALGLRLLFLLEAMDSPLFDYLYLDAKSYDAWGMEVAGGQLVRGEAFHMAPVYPYLLGAVYRVFGHNLLIVRVLQHLLGAASAVLVFAIARRLFGGTAGVLAYLLALGYGSFLYFEGQVLSSALGVFLGLLALDSLLRALARSGRGLLWAGLLLGLGSVARPNLLLFAPAAVLWILLREPAARRGTLAFLAGFGLALLPTTLHNFVVSGEIIPISSHGGVSFYLGNNPYTTGTYVPPPEFGGTPEAIDLHDSRRLAERELGRALSPSEISAYWYRKSFEFVREHPLRFAGLLARKTALYFNADEIPLDVNYAFDRRLYAVLRWSPFAFGLLLSLAAVGTALLFRARGRGGVLVLYVLANAASVIAFFVCARYRQTAVPAVAILAALALARAGAAAREKRWKGLAAIAAAFLVVSVPVHLDLYRGRETSEARSRLVLGRAYASAGDRARAEEWYREAIRSAPGNVDAHMNLGLLLYETKRFREAADSFAEAARLAPAFAGAWNNLGNALRESGETDRAIEAIREATEADTAYAGAYNNLGFTLASAGRPAEAEAAYRRAIRIEPSSALSWANLSDLQFRQGTFGEAIRTIEAAERANPADPAVRWKRESMTRAAALCGAAREAAGRGDAGGAARALAEALAERGAPVAAWAEGDEALGPILARLALGAPSGRGGTP